MARYYYRPGHPRANERGFVSAEDLGDYDPPRALDAPILVDRFYEGARTVEGEDIGSRRKRNEYMRRNGLADGNDFSADWYANRRAEMKREADKERRATLERVVYTKLK